MELTKRDKELFKKLSSYGMLSTKQIGDIFFNGVAFTTVLRRLRLLESSFYVKRINGLNNHELLWVLTPKGAFAVETIVPKRNWSKNMLEHDFKLLSMRLLLERYGIAESWTPEHEIRTAICKKYGLRNGKNRLIPDGLMGVDINGQKESIAIELELTLKSRRRLKDIIYRYKNTSGTFAVWYIADSKMILDQVYRAWSDYRIAGSSIKIFYSFYNDIMKNPLQAKLWSNDSVKTIGEYMRVRPAQVGAQSVSMQNYKSNTHLNELTTENECAITELAS